MSSEKRETGKTLLVAGAVGLGLYFLAEGSNQAGNNVSTPPVTTLTPPPSPATQTQGQIAWIYNQLAQFGFTSSPLWYSASSVPTELPTDTTTQGRNLVNVDQTVTDNYQQYFWSVNQFFGWNYPPDSGNAGSFDPSANFAGLTGAPTLDPTTDATQWAAMQQQYALLTQQLTPAFLS
jgi:hypothetical protein